MVIALLVIVLLHAVSASAQTYTATVHALTPPSPITVDQWTTRDGLPQNTVNAIAQTPDGYIWLGTFGGLTRFDGLRFEVIDRVDSAGHHVDRVLSLAVTPDSALWIGTERGLLRYRGGKFRQFTPVDGLTENPVGALYVDRAGTLWIGTLNGGAARYDGTRFTTFHTANGVEFGSVHSFAEDRAGTIWVNTRNRFLPVTASVVSVKRTSEFMRQPFDLFLLGDHQGDEWFRLLDGMGRLHADSALDVFRIGFGPEVMLEQQRRGSFWLGTLYHGVAEFDAATPNRTRRYPLPSGDSSYGARSLIQAKDGTVWAGTTRDGLVRLKPNLFTTYREANGLSHNVFTPVMEARDGSLWAGTNCGGVNVLDPSRRTVHTYLVTRLGIPGSDPCVFSIAQDSSGVVWIGTYGGGLTRIENGSVRRVGGLGVLRDSVILALFASRDGTLWVGTNSAGLARAHDGRVDRVYTTADGLASNSIRYITQTADGAIWVGTLAGLSRLNSDGRFTSYTSKDGLSSDHVRAVHEDSDGTLWIGTYGGGLNRFRSGKFIAISRADGLADNIVSSILDDGRGNLWMSGNRGIYRVARSQLNEFAGGTIRRVHSVLYGVGDGLINAETNGGFQPAAWKDHAGRLWFPTIQGLASVDPSKATDTPMPPPVVIDEIDVDGEPHAAAKGLQAGPLRPNVEFHYSAVSLSAPDNVTFRYRLEPLDHEWVEPGSRRIAYYSRLPAGNYRFLVTAANRDGVWNSTAAFTELTILAPLYQRTWFVTALLLLGAFVLWLAHEAVVRTRSAAIRDERSRLAREIHDSLLQGFGGIALELDAASARLALPPQQQRLLDRVLSLIDRTLTQARLAVWDIRPGEWTDADVAHECKEACERILGGTSTAWTVEVRGQRRRLAVNHSTECVRIVEEALTNVRKHAAAGHVSVLIDYTWSHVRITVQDDGQGFDPEQDGARRGHWGLLGMRERASRFGGKFAIESRIGGGTVVTVNAPYGVGRLSRRGFFDKN